MFCTSFWFEIIQIWNNWNICERETGGYFAGILWCFFGDISPDKTTALKLGMVENSYKNCMKFLIFVIPNHGAHGEVRRG